jgi:N-acyl-L-homoserine lactone synthetase
MIHIVNAENRKGYGRALRQMYRDRKMVFIERLGWNVAATGEFEIDAYDREDTMYLLATRPRDTAVLASARLLSTLRPLLMCDLFPHLCRHGPPRGPGIWEASRFCVSPTVTNRALRLRLLWEILCGIMEASLLFGTERVVLTANSALRPLVMRCGWDASTLGPTCPDGEDEVTAIQVRITLDGLHAIRTRFDIPSPVTRFSSGDLNVAA